MDAWMDERTHNEKENICSCTFIVYVYFQKCSCERGKRGPRGSKGKPGSKGKTGRRGATGPPVS